MSDIKLLAEVTENMCKALDKFLGSPVTEESINTFCNRLVPDGWIEEAKTIFNISMKVTHCLESVHKLEPLLKSASDKALEQVSELHIPVPFLECEIMRRRKMLEDWYVSRETDTNLGKNIYYVMIPKCSISYIKMEMDLDLKDQIFPGDSDEEDVKSGDEKVIELE